MERWEISNLQIAVDILDGLAKNHAIELLDEKIWNQEKDDR